MPLSQDQLSTLQNWMVSKGVRSTCGTCGTGTQWSTGEIVMAPVFSGGGMNIGGENVPMIQVICNNCAAVRLFAAVPMGLVS